MPALSWTALAAAQLAVIGTALRAAGAPVGYALFGGVAGLISVFAMALNVAAVIRRARRLRA